MKGGLFMVVFWVAFFAFEKALRWDVVEILAALVTLLFVPPIAMHRLMSRRAQAYCETHEDWFWYVVIGVTALTFLVYQIGDTPFHRRIKDDVTRFLGLWWCCWPYGCVAALMADRVFHLFGKGSTSPSGGGGGKLWDRLQLESEDDGDDDGEGSTPEPESAYIFDIARYKKDRLH